MAAAYIISTSQDFVTKRLAMFDRKVIKKASSPLMNHDLVHLFRHALYLPYRLYLHVHQSHPAGDHHDLVVARDWPDLSAAAP